MTSEEIKNWHPVFLKNMVTGHVEAIVENEFMWLREIAYQLAVMNETNNARLFAQRGIKMPEKGQNT